MAVAKVGPYPTSVISGRAFTDGPHSRAQPVMWQPAATDDLPTATWTLVSGENRPPAIRGDLIYDTTEEVVKQFNGSVWGALAGGAVKPGVDLTIEEINAALAAQSTDRRAFLNLRDMVPSAHMSALATAFDLTGRAYGGFVHGDGLHIDTAAGLSDPVFKLQNSQLWNIGDLTVFNNPGTAPSAFQMKRTGGASAGVHTLSRIGITNYGSVAGIEMDGAEACRLEQVDITTAASAGTPAPALYLHTTSGGLLTATFANCHFTLLGGAAGAGAVVKLERTSGDITDIHFLDCTFRAADPVGANPLAGLHVVGGAGTPASVGLHRCRFECDNCEYGIYWDGNSALLTIEDCTIIAKQPIRLLGTEHSGLWIGKNRLFSVNSSALIRVSGTNYGSFIDCYDRYGTSGGTDLIIDGSAERTLIQGFSGRVSGTVAASSLVQERMGAFLDAIGATQGQVLYRGAAAWAALAPGSAGQQLTSGGAAANPAWGAAS